MKAWRTEFPGATIERNDGGMDDDDIEEIRQPLAEQMSRLLAMIDAGTIDATPLELAYLKGAEAGLRTE